MKKIYDLKSFSDCESTKLDHKLVGCMVSVRTENQNLWNCVLPNSHLPLYMHQHFLHLPIHIKPNQNPSFILQRSVGSLAFFSSGLSRSVSAAKISGNYSSPLFWFETLPSISFGQKWRLYPSSPSGSPPQTINLSGQCRWGRGGASESIARAAEMWSSRSGSHPPPAPWTWRGRGRRWQILAGL